jgi:hypothetical protein
MTERQLKAKAYMDKYGDALRRVRQCEEQLEREQISVDAIRSTSDNDGMPHGSGISDPTADKAVRLVDKGMDLFEARCKAMEIQRRVFEVAYTIGGVEGDVLIERYIKLKDWTDVCDAVGYGWSQTHTYHRIGLDKVADKLRIE